MVRPRRCWRSRLTEELLGPLAPKLDPGLVAPVAAWLVSEECRQRRDLPGRGRPGGPLLHRPTQGYANPDLTLEDVGDHVDDIRDETGYSVPNGVVDDLSSLVERLR